MRSVPAWDAVLCACAVPLVAFAWYATVVSGSHPQAIIAAAVYTVAAGAIAVRRTHLLTSFVITYLAFAVLVLTGSGDALGVFPLIACVPLTICAVTTWAPQRWPGWVAHRDRLCGEPVEPGRVDHREQGLVRRSAPPPSSGVAICGRVVVASSASRATASATTTCASRSCPNASGSPRSCTTGWGTR